MAERIPQSTAIRVPLQAYLSADHITPATGKTIAVTVSKNGAAYGNPSGGATNAVEIGSGSYYVDLTTTDAGTLGPLFVKGTEGTIDNAIAIYNVANPHHAGFTGIPDAAANANGGLPILSVSATTLAYTVTTVSTASTTTNLTNLPTPPTDWLAAASVSAAAVTKIQAGLATPTNITAGTITTVTNLTNAPTAGDLTSTMKASVTTAATAATPTAAAVTGAVGSVAAGVSVSTNSDKTGYTLSAAGLDSITVTEPAGSPSGWNFRQWVRWTAMRLNRAERTPTTLTTKTAAGTTSTTQAVTDDGAGTETMGAAS